MLLPSTLSLVAHHLSFHFIDKEIMVQHSTTLMEVVSSNGEAGNDQEAPGTYSDVAVMEAEDLLLMFETVLSQFLPERGFLLFDQAGYLIQSTTQARRFCHLLGVNSIEAVMGLDPNCPMAILPKPVTKLCQLLVESRQEYPDYTLQLYDDIVLEGDIQLHITGRWMELPGYQQKCILVMIDDLTEIAHQRALCDAFRYKLTPRETDVWDLYMQGYSYQEIQEKLYISINTVKKHMKNIYSKCELDDRFRYSV